MWTSEWAGYMIVWVWFNSPVQCFSVEWLILDESDKLFEDGDKGFKNQVSIVQYTIMHGLDTNTSMF